MKRWTFRILVCVFFGTVTTVGVAWGLAAMLRVDYEETGRGMIEYGDVAWHVIMSENIGRSRIQSQPIWSDSRAYEIRQTTAVEQWMRVLGPERFDRDRLPDWSRARSGYQNTEYAEAVAVGQGHPSGIGIRNFLGSLAIEEDVVAVVAGIADQAGFTEQFGPEENLILRPPRREAIAVEVGAATLRTPDFTVTIHDQAPSPTFPI